MLSTSALKFNLRRYIKAPMLANRACYLYLRGRVADDEAVGHPTPEMLGVKSSAGKVGGGSASACPLVYPDAPQQSGFDTVEDRSCLEEGVMGEGPLGRLAGRGLHSSNVQLNRSPFLHKIHPKHPLMPPNNP